MEYHFNEIDPRKFQRLINAILVKRYGDNVRLTPLAGSDGGKDAETAPGNPNSLFTLDILPDPSSTDQVLQPGRYIFQVKHHNTNQGDITKIRYKVISEFRNEIQKNILKHTGEQRVNFFYLLTNVPASKDAINSVDKHRRSLIGSIPHLHADVWWGERIIAFLDSMPDIWTAYPELFAGMQVPIIGRVVTNSVVHDERVDTLRVFINNQFEKDKLVKFRQVELEQNLAKIFVNLQVNHEKFDDQIGSQASLFDAHVDAKMDEVEAKIRGFRSFPIEYRRAIVRELRFSHGILELFLGETLNHDKTTLQTYILEGGPGQGKSTITQMLAQIYRSQLKINKNDLTEWMVWEPKNIRLPFRIELRQYAKFLDNDQSYSVEQYIASQIATESGGRDFSIVDLQNTVASSSVILMFDGLDEVGNDKLREAVLQKIQECTSRFMSSFQCDLMVIITTRPPALAGHHEYLRGYIRVPIAPLDEDKIKEYTEKWLRVQVLDKSEKERIDSSLKRRLSEVHVKALATNPMQLSILLHFIRIKGEAFPNNRAQLYHSYFEIVIDRDVEKSVGISNDKRDLIESLHKFLGYKLHALTEAKLADGSFSRDELLSKVREWLRSRSDDVNTADELFRLGEERLGLIVVSKGEGNAAQYGFEIQPVREYFAAAYVNDEIRVDVEAVFAQMMIRPFWHEVALFLAGLRRNNEKANLIVKARELDEDINIGWKQEGRAIIIQLLQEGVLSQPPQVFQMALDFVLELLDVKFIPNQHEPEIFERVLPTLLQQNSINKNATRNKLYHIVGSQSTSNDEFALHRLYRVSALIIASDDLTAAFKKFSPTNSELYAKATLIWPYIYSKESILQEPPVFDDYLPDRIWAKLWLQACIRKSALQRIKLPSKFSQLVCEEWIMRPSLQRRTLEFPQKSDLAFWRVVDLLQTCLLFIDLGIYRLRISDAPRTRILEHISNDLLNGNDHLDFSGLNDDMEEIIRISINGLVEVLQALTDQNSDEKHTFSYLGKLIEKINVAPGLLGWFVVRVGGSVLQLRRLIHENVVFPLDRAEDMEFGLPNELFGEGQILDNLSQVLNVFYERSEDDIPFSIGLGRTIPKYIRKTDGSLVNVITLLQRSIYEQIDPEFSYLLLMDIPIDIVVPLITTSINELKDILYWIGSRTWTSGWQSKKLPRDTIKKIVRILKNEDDPILLYGSLVSLSTSNILKYVPTELILKMLTSSFGRSFIPEILPSFPRRSEMDETEQVEADALAQNILKDAESYGLRMTTIAARYLIEYKSSKNTPLLELEKQLKIEQ